MQRSIILKYLLSLLLISFLSRSYANDTTPTVKVEYELDPYYSNIGLYINTTDAPIEEVGEKTELEIYTKLLRNVWKPRTLVAELSTYPMPLAGLFLNEYHPGAFDKAEMSKEINWLKAVTAGFEEPYMLAFFFGNVIKFAQTDKPMQNGNFGYMGFLLGVSDYHIKDNALVRDNNIELEWKLKGDKRFTSHDLSWSFRLGIKEHSNPNIRDAAYFALRRSSIDYEKNKITLFKNVGLEYQASFDLATGESLSHFLMLDKNFPWKARRISFSLGIGLYWQNHNKYTGNLHSSSGENNLQLLLRPNIRF